MTGVLPGRRATRASAVVLAGLLVGLACGPSSASAPDSAEPIVSPSAEVASAVASLTVEPPVAPVGGRLRVTGSVDRDGAPGTWSFTVPPVVTQRSVRHNVLELVCRTEGTGTVTATYQDAGGAASASVPVRCAPAPSVVPPPPVGGGTGGPPTRGPRPSPRPTSEPRSEDPVHAPSRGPSRTPSRTSAPTSAPSPGPSGSPTPRPGGEDPLLDAVEDALARLEAGVVSYRPPRSMREGEPRELTVRVQRSSTPSDPADVPGEGPVVERPIEVGTPMSAKLVGSAFDVRPEGPVTRVVAVSRPSEWTWTITPTSTGKESLVLELAVLLDEDSETPIAVKKYSERIEVQVHPLHTSTRLLRAGLDALGALGVTAAVLGTAVWSWWKRRRSGASDVRAGRGAAARGTPRGQQGPGQRRRRRRR